MADKGEFFGAWASPTTVARLRALAQLRGVSQSEILRGLVEDAAARALGAVVDHVGDQSQEAPKHNRADKVLADTSAAVA